MSFDFDVARKHCQGLRQLIVLNAGGSRNDELLGRLRARRRAAASFIDDDICRRHLKDAERFARGLYSDDGHRNWAQAGLSGAAVLRLQMLGEIDACIERLTELEAGRTAHVQGGEQPGAEPD